MFRNTAPVTEPMPVVAEQADPGRDHLIPLSHLGLDLPAPATGWLVELDRRGISITSDDLGRDSIGRDDARQLIAEHHEAEARQRQVMERQEHQLIEADRVRRANLPSGIPAGLIPDGMTAAEMLFAGERRPRSVREQLLERELAHSEPELVYQSIGPDEG
jgi:hypothetical protein